MVGARSIVVALGVMVGLVALPDRAAAQAPEVFEGLVASTSAVRAGLSPFTISVQEYTTDDETAGLLKTLAEEGPEALAEALRDLEKGRFQVPGELSHAVGFARSLPHETGRIVRIAVARPIAMFELARAPRSRDYQIGIIELRLDADGNGSGVIVGAAKVEFNDDGELEIESYAQPPLSITRVSVKR